MKAIDRCNPLDGQDCSYSEETMDSNNHSTSSHAIVRGLFCQSGQGIDRFKLGRRRGLSASIAMALAIFVLNANPCSAQNYAYNRAQFTTGPHPVAAVADDFNGDGLKDLAVVNNEGNTVSILLGAPAATFAPKVDYAVGAAPTAIASGDFNGDGKIDLAVLNSTDNSVSILLGNGDGTFGPQVAYPAIADSIGLVIADFNGDGKLDLAVGSSQASVAILLGNGDGTFGTPTEVGVVGEGVQFKSGDFNGDGKVDLAVVNTGGNPARGDGPLEQGRWDIHPGGYERNDDPRADRHFDGGG